ncbi:MAG: hypothetical protein QOJ04_4150 [Caballeronia sp.]|jgi:hypothetical protein|nr:hypothetical protein [Caballeronia sp.]
MTETRTNKWRWRVAGLILGFAAVWGIYVNAKPVDEVVLTLGEPYQQVREQSRSTLPPAVTNASWGGDVSRPARLRFTDPKFGFVTPAAKFLTVGYDAQGKVWSVTLSPQIETLPLDDAMVIFIDLQDQLLRGGWHRIRNAENPPITDTPAIRAQIRERSDPITYWIADSKYEVILDIRRFVHQNRPNDERYLITLRLSGPPLLADSPGG